MRKDIVIMFLEIFKRSIASNRNINNVHVEDHPSSNPSFKAPMFDGESLITENINPILENGMLVTYQENE